MNKIIKECDVHSLYYFFYLRKEGDSNPRYPNRVRQFSKLVVSATHPSFLTEFSVKEWCKGRQKKQLCKISAVKIFNNVEKCLILTYKVGVFSLEEQIFATSHRRYIALVVRKWINNVIFALK